MCKYTLDLFSLRHTTQFEFRYQDKKNIEDSFFKRGNKIITFKTYKIIGINYILVHYLLQFES